MTENTAIIKREDNLNLAETLTLGKTLAESGYFSDARQAAQAVVKVLAGREMGIGPIASMTGINVIQGRIAIGANLMAAKVKGSGKYDYQVVRLDSTGCEIAFLQQGKELGRSTFTAEDAKRAGTGKLVAPGAKDDMLTRFPRNMLFSRAMSNGVRWFTPDVFLGPVYTPEELGADVAEDGQVVNSTATVIKPEPVQNVTSPESKEITPPAAAKKRHSWPAGIVDMLIHEGYSENVPACLNMLNLSKVLTPLEAEDIVLKWAHFYRERRLYNDTPEIAAGFADERIKPPQPEPLTAEAAMAEVAA